MTTSSTHFLPIHPSLPPHSTYKVVEYLFGLVVLDAELEVDHLAHAGVQRAPQHPILRQVSVFQPQGLSLGLLGTSTFLASATIPLWLFMAKIWGK